MLKKKSLFCFGVKFFIIFIMFCASNSKIETNLDQVSDHRSFHLQKSFSPVCLQKSVTIKKKQN